MFYERIISLQTRTPPIGVAVLVVVSIRVRASSQLVQTEVSDFQDESRIHDAVRRLEITVTLHFRRVEIHHATHDVVYQGSSEHAIEL